MDNNNLNFINNGFNSDLQSQTTDTRSENSNINYHNANTPDYNNGYPMMNGGVFPASYTNTPVYTDTPGNSDLSQSYPTASSDSPNPPQYVSQCNSQNATQSNPSLFNSPNMTNYSQINHSEIFITFDIPGIKIIIIPTFPTMMAYPSQANHSEILTFEISGSKVVIIKLSFQ
ncbi:hypothetical protein RhiirA5_465860 [Rhizophagus irregularis]|uniref:Uncharacterized protein n=1 Tax=Rhizophagus irregularis TaxID=588596 RepID=A0A2I1E9P6_9GLOM|nr:hypothetical protein RhiirA5_465860 [Rhizophagus irregularis]PKC72388.1 hypothetical protein RhiirA1_438291 [Rhizophagus irregularis]PKY18813.1 hypothetical protein RhiirB3_492549 [Rhizophagus irregularis]CAB4482831.1 unnamed protein product [Rhizophagus irregularis]CAB5199135.1 unnamed protein product [Rhizophagus irregularis]